MDHRSIWKDTLSSIKWMWESFLREKFLTLAFTYRRLSDNVYDTSGNCLKDCLTVSFLGQKLMMRLWQDKPS